MATGRHATVLVFLILFAAIPAGAATPAHASATDPTLTRTITLSLTPSEPGTVAVTVQFIVPDTVTEVTTRLPEDGTDVRSESFTNTGNTTWRWQRGNGTRPTISFTAVVNETGVAQTLDAQGSYLFVDVGPWALGEVPRMPVQWLRTGAPVDFESTVTTDGPGATGGEMVFLGPVTEYTRTAHDQTFRLIVPEAATLHESPTAILTSLTAASDTLRVGERDDEVVFIAAPTSINWGARGLAGGSDAWVVADEQLDTPANAWLHEYLHTRQSFRTTPTTRWVTEGIATYYAALLTLEQDRISFAAFRDHLARGSRDPYAEAILADPRTWPAGANYLKGALVWGGLDFEIRQATDSHNAAADVFARLNAHEGEVGGADLLEMASAVGGETAEQYLQYYTTEPVAPDPWTREQHRAVFDTDPPRMVVELAPAEFRLTGPYRTQSSIPDPIVVNETLTVTATITNVGDLTGTYEATLTIDGHPVATRSVTVPAGETITVSLAHTFETDGIYTVAIGPATTEVRVAEPVTPTVTDLTVNTTTISPGEAITLTVTATNTGDWPGGPLPVTVDGNTVTTINPTLTPGEQTTTEVVLNFSARGDHEIVVGNQSIPVTVTRSPTQPGFGLGTAAVAVLLAALALLYRRQAWP
ncbi:MAG: CARDB domain-containing protein [Halobacteriaceae archaeon]